MSKNNWESTSFSSNYLWKTQPQLSPCHAANESENSRYFSITCESPITKSLPIVAQGNRIK